MGKAAARDFLFRWQPLCKQFLAQSFIFLGLKVAWAAEDSAKPFISPVFGDNMVLQREKPNPIWGWAKTGETWAVSCLDDRDWKTVIIPGGFAELDVPKTPSVCYSRKTVVLPDPIPTGGAKILLGVIERTDTTQVNGRWGGACAWVDNPVPTISVTASSNRGAKSRPPRNQCGTAQAAPCKTIKTFLERGVSATLLDVKGRTVTYGYRSERVDSADSNRCRETALNLCALHFIA